MIPPKKSEKSVKTSLCGVGSLSTTSTTNRVSESNTSNCKSKLLHVVLCIVRHWKQSLKSLLNITQSNWEVTMVALPVLILSTEWKCHLDKWHYSLSWNKKQIKYCQNLIPGWTYIWAATRTFNHWICRSIWGSMIQVFKRDHSFESKQ